MKTAEQLKTDLAQLTTKGLGPHPEYAEIDVHAPCFVIDGVLHVSTEYSVSSYWADYYGEFRGGYPWINPALEQWAKDHGGYWEWQDPGSIGLYSL